MLSTDASNLYECHRSNNPRHVLIIFQGTIEADRDGAARISDFWRSGVLPFRGSTKNTQPSFICYNAPDPRSSRASGMKIAKANDMYAFGVLAWEVVVSLRMLESFTQEYTTAVYRRTPAAICGWRGHHSRLDTHSTASIRPP